MGRLLTLACFAAGAAAAVLGRWRRRGALPGAPVTSADGAPAPGPGQADLPGDPLVPGAHQVEAVEAAVAELRDGGRATVIMACGSGKTLVGAEVARVLAPALAAPLVVVLLPSIALVQQTMLLWRRQRPLVSARILCVCSDESAGEPDELRVTADELACPVSTDPAVIRAFIASAAPAVVFATYHSAPALAAGLPDGRDVDLAVFDEAHRTAGVDGKGFGFALAQHSLPICRRLFVTATPRLFEARCAADGGDAVEVRSMDDQAVYGKQVYRLSALEAARRGIVANLQLVIGFVAAEDGGAAPLQPVDSGSDEAVADLARLVALRKFTREYGLSKVFTFHATIAAAQRYAALGQRAPADPDVETALASSHINGAMSSAQRAQILARFEQAEQAQLTSVRCLVEGVDVPTVDAVAIMARKRSKLEIVQIAGRAMRKSGPSKTSGYLYVPVLLRGGQGATLEEALGSEQLEAVLDVVEAMQECDDSVRDALRQMRRARGRGDSPALADVHPAIQIDGPAHLLPALRRALVTRLVTTLTSTWEEMFGALQAFAAEQGHANVPQGYRTATGMNLGAWLSRQRKRWVAGLLAAQQRALLEGLGVCIRVHHVRFDAMLERLEAFHRVHGHCKVPSREDQKLALWIRNLRKRIAKGANLDDDRRARLALLGFEWRLLERLTFAEWLERLQRYRAQHGGGTVFHSRDPALHFWVKGVNDGRYALSAEQKALLDAAGFPWVPGDGDWETMLAELKRVHQGPCGPDGEYGYGEVLARWITRQRYRYRLGCIEPQQRAALEAAGLVLDAWELRLRELQAFEAANGHCRPPPRSRLGRWAAAQRKSAREGTLPPERKASLDALGFPW